jgi:hypothetical protein
MKPTERRNAHQSDPDDVAAATVRGVLVTCGDGKIGGVVHRTLADTSELSCATRRPAFLARHLGNSTRLSLIQAAFKGSMP